MSKEIKVLSPSGESLSESPIREPWLVLIHAAHLTPSPDPELREEVKVMKGEPLGAITSPYQPVALERKPRNSSA